MGKLKFETFDLKKTLRHGKYKVTTFSDTRFGHDLMLKDVYRQHLSDEEEITVSINDKFAIIEDNGNSAILEVTGLMKYWGDTVQFKCRIKY